MNVLLFGASGMIGQGVLRECLLDPEVSRVLAVGRSPSGQTHAKLTDLVARDLTALSPTQLAGYDACFFSLGVTSLGMNEEQYTKVTYDLTVAIARPVLEANPNIVFVYVSGQSTDSTERGSTMWARVKGRTENALLAMSKRMVMFRPGAIIPLHGIKSRTGWYNAFYAVAKPLLPVLRVIAPSSILTTEQLGRAMLVVAKRGAPKQILETRDIAALAAGTADPSLRSG
jgi:uncharacterized protein YbjT (DUF2867 family)